MMPYHQTVEKVEDMCILLDTITERDGQTDGQKWYINIAFFVLEYTDPLYKHCRIGRLRHTSQCTQIVR